MAGLSRSRGVAVAAVAVAAAGALVVATREGGGGPARPAGPVPEWARPLVEATTLPPGWYRLGRPALDGEEVGAGPGRTGWAERVTYRHLTDPLDTPWGEVTFTTTSGVDPEERVGPEDVRRMDPQARWVTLGPRRVMRWVVRLRTAAHRYLWTEAPGVEVLVEPVGHVTDAEVQALVAGARPAGPRPSPALARPTPEPGARVLLPEVNGRGSTVLGPFRVGRGPFSVHVACTGNPLRVSVNKQRGRDACDRPEIAGLHVRHAAEGPHARRHPHHRRRGHDVAGPRRRRSCSRRAALRA
jgi:hypothetical protein